MQGQESALKYQLMQDPAAVEENKVSTSSINRKSALTKQHTQVATPTNQDHTSEFDNLRTMMINTRDQDGVPHRRAGAN